MNFGRLTEKQQQVLGLIAMNEDAGHHPQVLKSLVNKGLIEAYKEDSHDRYGKLVITKYRMPLPVHIEWCNWCSKQYEENGRRLMGARRIKNCGKYAVTDFRLINSADFMAKIARDCRSYKAKKEKRKEIRRLNEEAQGFGK